MFSLEITQSTQKLKFSEKPQRNHLILQTSKIKSFSFSEPIFIDFLRDLKKIIEQWKPIADLNIEITT